MKKEFRVLKNYEFSSIIQNRQFVKSSSFVCYFQKRKLDHARVGISVGKKLGNAAMIISILGGVALVITSITELIKSFADSGVTLGEGIGIILTSLLGIAGAFAAIAASTKLLNVDDLFTLITR